MNTRIIRRGLSVAAVGAAAVLAMPGAAFAAQAPNVTAQTGINTVSFTITIPEMTGGVACVGPWIHTEADATAILNSPTLDVANNPRNWFVGAPVSPRGTSSGDIMNSDGTYSYVYPTSGQTEVAKIPYIPDGRYVAGSLCMRSAGDGSPIEYALTQTPFTIGNATSEPGGTGSLSFGS